MKSRDRGMRPGRLYWPARAISSPFRRQWFDLHLEGVENVPAAGPVVLAPNHISFLDSFLLMYGLPRKVVFLGKAEYLESWRTRIFRAAGMIPIDRGGKGLVASLGQAAAVLEAGGAVGIFPEGTRSRDGRIHEGHTGAAHLALRTRSALVPVGIIGTDRIQPPGARFPSRGGEVVMRFGAPLDMGGHRAGAAARRAVTRELMHSIAVLARRPYAPSASLAGAVAAPA